MDRIGVPAKQNLSQACGSTLESFVVLRPIKSMLSTNLLEKDENLIVSMMVSGIKNK